MATSNVQILERSKIPPSGGEFFYCDTLTPGVMYRAIAASNSDTDINAAIVAHIRLRLVAGLDYPDKPAPVPAALTVTF